jgi:hypothetical protein
MYAYSPDSAHLVFHDGFGQTRVSFGKKHKAKTDKKELASPFAGSVSINRAGDRVLTYRDEWDKTTLWELPSMKPVERFPRFEKRASVLHPDGTHLIYWRGLEPKLVFEAYPGGDETELTLSREGDVAFPEDVWIDAPRPLVTGEAGSFAALGKGTVVSGFMREGSVDITNYTKLALEGAVQLFASPAGAAVVAHLAGTSTVYTPGGDVFTLETLTPAQVGGGFVAWQPDDATIARRPLGGGDEERFSLEGDDVGRAFVYPGTDRLCAMPWHREDVLDLLGGQRVSRKLKAAEVAPRRAMLEHIRAFTRAAHTLPVSLEFPELRVNPKYSRVEPTGRGSSGRASQTLKIWLLFRLLYDSWERREYSEGWRVGSYGLSGAGLQLEPHVEVDDDLVREAIEWFQSFGVRFGKPNTLFLSDDRVSDDMREWLSSLRA